MSSIDYDFIGKWFCEKEVCIFPDPLAFVISWIHDWFLKESMQLWRYFKIPLYIYIINIYIYIPIYVYIYITHQSPVLY